MCHNVTINKMNKKYFILILCSLLLVTSVFAQTPQSTEEERDPEPDEIINVDIAPEPLNMDEIKKKIEYPHVLKEQNIYGKVFIKVLVDK